MPDPLQDQLQSALGTTYRIDRELGGGGMSRVFLATESALERRVVIKVLPADLAADVSTERFKREITLAAQLQHPHIVPLLAAGVAQNHPYYTMPYVDGETLRTRIARDGELPLSDAVSILRDVVKGIAYAHRHGVVHRDIKPENILLADDSALVADFGVAKALSAAAKADSAEGATGGLTTMGIALGTPTYMAPEQAAADPMTDHRADIYALSVMAYEMLTGHPPFTGRSPQAVLAAHMTEVPENISRRRPQIPAPLATLIMRGLEKRPADRPQSAAELLQTLDSIATPSGGMTPREGLMPTGGLPAVRRPFSRAAVAMGVMLLLGALGAGAWVVSRGSPIKVVNERVLIVPFTNKTGDASLASLGIMASDWITRSLSESRVADVPVVPQGAADAAQELTAERIGKLARLTGAATIVGGFYYRLGDSVQFTAQLADARRGEVVQTIGPVSAPASSPVAAIEQLRQRLVGALAARLDTTSTDIADATNQPPSYEAYREYLTADAAFRASDFDLAAQHFLAASRLDSNFTFPLVRAAYAFENLAEFSPGELDSTHALKVDSIERVLRPRRARMSAYDVAYLDRVLGWRHGDYNASYTAGRQLAALAPRSIFARFVAARSALPVNRLHEARAGLDSVVAKGEANRDPTVYRDLCGALHNLGEHERELEVSHRSIAAFPQRVGPLASELYALAALGRTEEVLKKVDAILAVRGGSDGDPVTIAAATAGELLWHGKADAARAVAARALGAVGSGAPLLRTVYDVAAGEVMNAAVIAGKLDEAERLLAIQMPAPGPGQVAWRGVLAARRGDSTAARGFAARLAAMKSPYVRGGTLYGRARIAAALGEKEQAVNLLRSAFADGLTYDGTVHGLPEFAAMRDYPPFVQLMTPKG